VRVQPLTEWLELMLAEIERKQGEARQTAEEESRRGAAKLHPPAAPARRTPAPPDETQGSGVRGGKAFAAR
jgi:hypothetical protein